MFLLTLYGLCELQKVAPLNKCKELSFYCLRREGQPMTHEQYGCLPEHLLLFWLGSAQLHIRAEGSPRSIASFLGTLFSLWSAVCVPYMAHGHMKNAMWLVRSGIFSHLALLLIGIVMQSCSAPTKKASMQSEVIKTSEGCPFPRGTPLAPPGR